MFNQMILIFQMPFAQMAFYTLIPLSILCGIVGSLIVANRLSYVAGGLTHGAYGGIGIGIYFGFSILWSTMAFALFLALIIAYLMQHHKQLSDNFIGAIWAFGMALGILLIDLSSGYKADMTGYLFGNILMLSKSNFYLLSLMSLGFLILTILLYPQIQALSYDEDFAKIRGISCKAIFYLLILMISACVVVSMQAVGLILVIALLSIPTFIAKNLSKTLKGMICISIILNFIFCFLGLLLSFAFDLSSGACIIMVCVFGFTLFFFYKTLK